MKTAITVIAVILVVGAGAFWALRRNVPEPMPPSAGESTPPPTPNAVTPKNSMRVVTIKTNFGDIKFETFDADAPKTVENFITLAERGFYNNLTFHRVVAGFVIQGGDPAGNGTGGPGYTFTDELNTATESYKAGYRKGVVAMANAGPNTNGSQFFILLQDRPTLPHRYTIFGRVIAGQDAVDAIGRVAVGANGRPTAPVIMSSVTAEVRR